MGQDGLSLSANFCFCSSTHSSIFFRIPPSAHSFWAFCSLSISALIIVLLGLRVKAWLKSVRCRTHKSRLLGTGSVLIVRCRLLQICLPLDESFAVTLFMEGAGLGILHAILRYAGLGAHRANRRRWCFRFGIHKIKALTPPPSQRLRIRAGSFSPMFRWAQC